MSILLSAAFLVLSAPLANLTPTSKAPDLVRYWQWLQGVQAAHPDRDSRLIAWCKGRLGVPYALDCQGEGEGQDSDPLFTPDKVDCTVLVLQAAASWSAKSPLDLLNGMLRANYRRWNADGRVTYADRLHYSEDRILTSPLFADITLKVFSRDALVPVHMVLNRKADGTETVPLNWSREVDMYYRPGYRLTSQDLERFPRVCGVMFVRKSNFRLGLIVGHEGIVVGGTQLYHASSKAKRVVCVPFLPYARETDGIILFDFK